MKVELVQWLSKDRRDKLPLTMGWEYEADVIANDAGDFFFFLYNDEAKWSIYPAGYFKPFKFSREGISPFVG